MQKIGLFLRLVWRQLWGIAALLAAWQALVIGMDFNAIVLPRPGAVLAYLATRPGDYVHHALHTIAAALIGLVLGLALGTLLAVAAWLSRVLDGMLLPLGLVFSSVPVITLVPVIGRIVGDGFPSVLAVVTVICFFPAFVFTSSGMRALPPGSADLFHVLGASRIARLGWLALPAAVPDWTVAMRITASQAVLAAMAAEYLMGSSGLGFLFAQTKAEFDMDPAIGAAVLGTLVSAGFAAGAATLGKHLKEQWT